MNDLAQAQKVMVMDTIRKLIRSHLTEEVSEVVNRTIDQLAEKEIKNWLDAKGKTPYALGVVFIPDRKFWIYHDFGKQNIVGFNMQGSRLSEKELDEMAREPVLTLYYANIKNIIADMVKRYLV